MKSSLVAAFLFMVATVWAKEAHICFDGSSYIQLDVGKKPIRTIDDKITLKFRSSDASGLLLYALSRGLYGDHIFIELVNGKLRIRYQLGQNDTLKEDVMGDGLGDDTLSTVIVSRTKKTLKVSAYGGQSDEVTMHIPGDDDRLDLNGYIYVGGYPALRKDYPSKNVINLKGCMMKAVFNAIDLLDGAKNKNAGFKSRNIDITDSRSLPSRPMNFKKETFLEMVIQREQTSDPDKYVDEFFGHFSFRTTIVSGQIFQASSVSLAFQESQLLLKSGSLDIASLQFPNNGYASDGRWYDVKYFVKNDLMVLTLNGKEKRINPRNNPQYGDKIRFGFQGEYQFIGCIRDLVVQKTELSYPIIIDPYQQGKIADFKDLDDGCKASDPCVPNPCFHEAQCFSYAKGIHCECIKNYMKPFCQFSQYKTTCADILKSSAVSGSLRQKYYIDPDDSGPQPPVQVLCDFKIRPSEGQTEIETKNAKDVVIKEKEKSTKYSDPFSYKKEIEYGIPLASVKAIVDRSHVCEQNVKYNCLSAKLFDQPGGSPSSRWLSANGYLQYYWGGATHDSYKCACAYTEIGCRGGKMFCNCDSGEAKTNQMSDEGLLNTTRDLPVQEVQFGGLTTPSFASFTIDKVICYGVDALGAVTFIARDGWLRLPPWNSPLGGDISFYIKTVFTEGSLIDHRNSDESHFFQVNIHDESTISVVYSFGTSIRKKYLAKMNERHGKLSDNKWHKIHIIRTLRYLSVRIDGSPTTIPNESEEKTEETLTDDGRSRLNIDLPMFVGAFWRYPTYKKGYIGCMKGFTINGVMYDLVNAVDHLAHEPEALVLKGCGHACEFNPCPYGKCVEKYTSYECDCTDTPFYGKYCSQEIGADIQNSAIIAPEVNVTTGRSQGEKIVLAFTSGSDRCKGTLVEMLSKDEQQYYKLSLVDRNELQFKFKLVRRLNEEIVSIKLDHVDFCDTTRHIVYIERNLSAFVKYAVDGRPTEAKRYKSKADGFFYTPYYFYVGNSKNDRTQDSLFSGCLSGVKIHLNFTNRIIKTVEPIREGIISNDSDSGIKQKSCGASINTPSPMTDRNIPGPTTPTDYPSTEFIRDVGIHEAEDSNWAVLIVVALLMMLLLVALVVVTVWFVMQHKNDYQILEKEDGTVIGTATVRGGASAASVPVGNVTAAAPSQASHTSHGNLSRAKSRSNDVFI